MIREYKEKEQESMENKNIPSSNVKIPDAVSKAINQNSNSNKSDTSNRRKPPSR